MSSLEPLHKLKDDIKHFDPHVRQNAVIAYGNYIENEKERSKLTPAEKTSIIGHLLDRLEPSETSIEVKGRTVKIFSNIAKFLDETEISQVFTKIITYITNEKAEGKDIYVACIKNIIQKVPDSFYQMIGKVILPVLNKGLESTNKEIVTLSIDSLNDYIEAFCYLLKKINYTSLGLDVNKYMKICLKHIMDQDDRLKTNSIEFLGHVSVLLKKNDIIDITNKIIDYLKKTNSLKEKINCLLALQSIAKDSAINLVDTFKTLIPLLSMHLSSDFLNNNSLDYDEKNQTVEACLNLIEIFCYNSLSKIKEFLNGLVELCLNLIDFDPGFDYNCAENEEVAYDPDAYDEYDMPENDANMDDSSWKVRKAGVKLLSALAKSGYTMEKEQREKIISKLVICLREHEENTKVEIINALSSFLSGLVVVQKIEDDLSIKKKASSLIDVFLPKISDELISSVIKEMKGKNDIIKEKILNILPVLATVSPYKTIENFNKLEEIIDANCFTSNDNTMTLMRFLLTLFKVNPLLNDYEAIYPKIYEYIKKGINHKFYKVNAEAINCCGALFEILASDIENNKTNIRNLVNLILPKFKSQDIDAAIKIVTISAFAEYITQCNKIIDENEINELFNIYVTKASNDLLKGNVLSALIKIVEGERHAGIEKYIGIFKNLLIDIITSAATFVQIKALNLIEAIFEKYPSALSSYIKEFVTKIIIIKNQEGFIQSVYSAFSSMVPVLTKDLIINIIKYTEGKLPDLQVNKKLLTPIYDFTRKATKKIKSDDIKDILSNYSKDMKNLKDSQSYFASILICFAGLEKQFISSGLKSIPKINDDSELSNVLALIGNICENSKEKHIELINDLEKLKTKSKAGIKEIISSAIGQIGVNNSDEFLKKIQNEEKDYYCLLSLNEFLSIMNDRQKSLSNDQIKSIINLVLGFPELNKEDINKLVGSCSGLALSLNIDLILSYLDMLKNAKNAYELSALYYGLKYIFKLNQSISRNYTNDIISSLIEGVKNNERLVKQNSLISLLSFCSYYKNEIPVIVKEYNICDILNETSKINQSFIKEVDFGGGNKMVEDSGIDIRKNSLEIIKLLIESIPNKLNLDMMFNLHINCLLDTDEDVRNIVFDNLYSLAHLFPSSFVPISDKLFDNLMKCYRERIRQNVSKKNYSVRVNKIFNELNGETSITSNKKYEIINTEIVKYLK